MIRYIHYEHYSGNLTHGNLTHTGRYDMELHEETGKPINTIIISHRQSKQIRNRMLDWKSK